MDCMENETKYGRWTILRDVEDYVCRGARYRQVVAVCDCGVTKTCILTNLKSGRSRSCGCYKRETPSKATHLMSDTPEYEVWSGMKKRCLNHKYREFHLYGGRGITIDPTWQISFETFFRDMGPKPSGMSIDRIDVNGPYAPDNCRWADSSEQNRNRRNTVWVALGDRRVTLSDLSKEAGVNYFKLYNHIVRNGEQVESALVACESANLQPSPRCSGSHTPPAMHDIA